MEDLNNPVLTAVPPDVSVVLGAIRLMTPPSASVSGAPTLEMTSAMRLMGKTMTYLMAAIPEEHRKTTMTSWFDTCLGAAGELANATKFVELTDQDEATVAAARDEINKEPKLNVDIFPAGEKPQELDESALLDVISRHKDLDELMTAAMGGMPKPTGSSSLLVEEGNARLRLTPQAGAILQALTDQCPVTSERAMRDVDPAERGLDTTKAIEVLAEITAAILATAPEEIRFNRLLLFCKDVTERVRDAGDNVQFEPARREVFKAN